MTFLYWALAAASLSYAGTPSPYLPGAATNRNNQTSQITYDTSNSYGNVASVLSPRGVMVTTTYQYPADFPLGQVLSVAQSHLNAGGAVDDTKEPTTFTYYGPANGVLNGLPASVTSPLPDTTVTSPNTVTTTYSYDSLGNITQTTGPNANGTMTVTYNYTTDGAYSQAEALGEPLLVTVSGPDANYGLTTTVTHYRYDNRGNRTAVIDALNNETDFVYNLADQLTDTIYPATGDSGSGRAKTTTAYQYPGGSASSTTVADETGNPFRQVSSAYDSDGELTGVSGDTYPVGYTYDGCGRVRSVTYYGQSLMDSHTTTYDYDPVGNLAAVHYPNQSGATFDQLYYTYDADGNLATETDGIGVTKTYTRNDPESLLTGISYSNYPLNYAGTPLGPVSFGFDHWGRRQTMSNDATAVTYIYDDLDELLSTSTDFGLDNIYYDYGPTGQQVVYTHNPDGSRQSLSLPYTAGGNSQNYEYDGVGRLTATYLPNGPVYGSRYTYLPNGWLSQMQATSAAYPTYDANGNLIYDVPYLQTNRTYNARGFLTALTNSPLGGSDYYSPPSSYSNMTYDPDGNRLQETASLPAWELSASLSRRVQYGYDRLDQLTSETSTPASGADPITNYAHTWAYDLSGNPTTNPLGGASFNADNQNTALGYNGNGDPLSLSFFSWLNTYSLTTDPATFDAEDRLTLMGYSGDPDLYASYDGDGLRAWSYPGPFSDLSYYLYDGDRPVAEVDYTGTELAFTMTGATGTELRYQDYDDQFYNSPGTAYMFDPQGSLAEPVTLDLGNDPPYPFARSTSVYDAFGGSYSRTPIGADTYYKTVGFGGQQGYYQDPSTGLYLLTHRYYDASAGRFVNRDPIGYKGGINLYGFAGNNPVNRSDPSGFIPTPIGGFPINPEGDDWYPHTFLQGWNREVDNWRALPGRLYGAAATLGDGFLQGVQQLDNSEASECGCSQSPQESAGMGSNAPMQMAGKAGGGSQIPGGLRNASSGLKELFSEGSVKGKSIIFSFR